MSPAIPDQSANGALSIIPVHNCWTSLKLDNPTARRAFFKASNSPDEVIDGKPVKLNLCHVYVDQVQNSEGELLLRTVLIDDAGKSYQTFSSYVRRAVGLLFKAFGLPPWPSPIAVKLDSQKGNDNHTFYTLDLDDEAPTVKGKK